MSKYYVLLIIIFLSVSFGCSYSYNQIIPPTNYTGIPINLGQTNLNFDKNNTFSISFTIQRGSTISNECILCKNSGSSVFTQGYNLYTDGQLFIIQLNGQNGNDVTFQDMIRARSSINIDNNKPQNILLTYNGNGSATGIIFKINGTVYPLNIIYNNLSTSIRNSNNVYLGSMNDGSSNKFTGTITNMTIYSGIYTTVTIKSISDNLTVLDSIQKNATYYGNHNFTKTLSDSLLIDTTFQTSSQTHLTDCTTLGQGYVMVGYDNKTGMIKCSSQPVTELSIGHPIFCQTDYNTIGFGIGNCNKYKFLGIGTASADDPLVIDGRMYLNPPSQPVDTRISIVGVHSGINPDGSQHCLSEGILFSDDQNVSTNRNNELANFYIDNCSHMIYIGHYTPLGNNDFTFNADESIDSSGNVNILRGHFYVQGQLVK